MHDSMITRLPSPPPEKTGWPWTKASLSPSDLQSETLSWLPRVSIVTPSYNQGQFIEATLRSVLLQGYPNLEYIVIDGSSTDDSVSIIRRYEPWLAYWVSEPDRGQSHAINKGLERGTGEIFAWLNSDDLLLPGALWRIADAYRSHPDSVAWVGHCHLIKPDGRIIKTVTPKGLDHDSLADWFYGGFIFQPSCFFSARAWREAGGVDESLYFVMDFELWLKLSALGDFTPVQETISAAIIHGEAKTQAQRPEMHAETMFVQFKYGYREMAYKRLNRLLESTVRQHQKSRSFTGKVKRALGKLFTNGKKETQYVQFSPDTISISLE